MASKIKSVYICSQCGYESPKWYGKCPSCGEWNTMNEEIKDASKLSVSVKTRSFSEYSKPESIEEISTENEHRYDTANKLLKLVEEPLEDTLIIMVSNDSKSILPTISSRLQRVTLRPLSDQTVTSILMEENPLDENDAKAIAHLSLGNMIEAMRQLSLSEEQSSFFEMFKSLMRLAYQRKIKDLREWANDLAALGREKELKFYEYTSRLIRENFIYNFALPELNYLNSAEGDFSRNFARFITERNVEKLIEVFDNARTDIAGNGNGKIINLDVAIKTILLLKS